MAGILRASSRMAPAVIAAWTLLAGTASAAGAFDGTWVIDIPSSPTAGNPSTPPCPALRLQARIVDSRVTGSLERVASGTPNTVEPGSSRAASPITGMVQPDGALAAEWEGYRATGKLSGDTGQITVQGQCGPRSATASRVAK
jgi:hypothetical protein